MKGSMPKKSAKTRSRKAEWGGRPGVHLSASATAMARQYVHRELGNDADAIKAIAKDGLSTVDRQILEGKGLHDDGLLEVVRAIRDYCTEELRSRT